MTRDTEITTYSPLADSKAFIKEHYEAGAKQIGVSCNPIQLKLFITADDVRLIVQVKGNTQRQVRITADILHDFIAALPARPAASEPSAR